MCHRVIVGDEIESLALFLKADGRLHRAEEIADVEFSARLEAGENAHGEECGFPAGNRSSGEREGNAEMLKSRWCRSYLR